MWGSELFRPNLLLLGWKYLHLHSSVSSKCRKGNIRRTLCQLVWNSFFVEQPAGLSGHTNAVDFVLDHCERGQKLVYCIWLCVFLDYCAYYFSRLILIIDAEDVAVLYITSVAQLLSISFQMNVCILPLLYNNRKRNRQGLFCVVQRIEKQYKSNHHYVYWHMVYICRRNVR